MSYCDDETPAQTAARLKATQTPSAAARPILAAVKEIAEQRTAAVGLLLRARGAVGEALRGEIDAFLLDVRRTAGGAA